MRIQKPKKIQRSVHLNLELDRALAERVVVQGRTFSSVIESLIIKGLKAELESDKAAIMAAQEKKKPV
jgi:hypothetical protein